ncbi:MAG: hypothetical protein N2646_06585, partial [Bellilinea sp.]|nr:hypothetical protein [Bellilinea sp.]
SISSGEAENDYSTLNITIDKLVYDPAGSDINNETITFTVHSGFVNFADGGGWLARKRDLYRLWENCHYFLNLHNLSDLEKIVYDCVPKKYHHSR